MGILAQIIEENHKVNKPKEVPQVDFEYTRVRLVAKDTGNSTVIRVIKAKYSVHGDIDYVIELPSFSGIYSELYSIHFGHFLELAWDIADILNSVGEKVNILHDPDYEVIKEPYNTQK